DPNATLPDGSAGGIGAENMKPGAATDEVVGDRTINDSTTPSGDTGKLTTLLSNLANRIRAIMGTSSWRSGPPTTLQAAKEHIDAPAPHSGHETPAGAQAKVDAHANRRDNPHQVTAAQVGAITSVAGISNPGGGVDIVAGSAISITKDTTNKRIVINAHTEGAAPGPHASTHAYGGSDPITPAMIGAAPASHNHSASQITSGTLPVARGGTGLSSLTAGSYLRASSSSAFELRTPAQVRSDIGTAPASHTHSPADVGLGNVPNYGIATQSEAEAGSVNNKYMPPLRTKQAIDASGTSQATANTLVRRDAAGRAKVAAPQEPDDIATKGYVDSNFVPRGPTILSVTFKAPFTVPAGGSVAQFLAYTGPSRYGAIPSLVPPVLGLGTGRDLEVVVVRENRPSFPTPQQGIEVRLRNLRSSDNTIDSDITVYVMIIPFP